MPLSLAILFLFLIAATVAIVAATGNISAGLWYPVGVSALGFVVTLFCLPETYFNDET